MDSAVITAVADFTESDFQDVLSKAGEVYYASARVDAIRGQGVDAEALLRR